jgi:hypothetical protein
VGEPVIAYKFLRDGAVGVFSRFAWPRPVNGEHGQWVEADGIEPCRSGIHACRRRDLPYWLASELWELELDPAGLVEERTKVIASRGRLLRRIETWDEASRADYTDMCAARARERIAAVPELERWGDVIESATAESAALTGFVAARIAEAAVGREGWLAEREHQSEWLAERLALRA